MPKATVTGVDTFYWHDDPDDPTSTLRSAERGETVDVPKETLDKHVAEGHLSTGSGSGGYPGTHAELDDLAADAGFEWPEGTKTVADKQAALADAGVEPEASTE